jgi:hypothetical protein
VNRLGTLKKLNLLGARGTGLITVLLLWAAASPLSARADEFAAFLGLRSFNTFAQSTNSNGWVELLSSEIPSPIRWNELIVSWNAQLPPEAVLKVEARAVQEKLRTRFYTLGLWSAGSNSPFRTSVALQKDAAARVETDTLKLRELGDAIQIRLSFSNAPADAWKQVRFLGFSFANTKLSPKAQPPNRAAWGKNIPVPERSQLGYKNGIGWCSPASLSMVLSHWSGKLNRPELNLSVPETAVQLTDPAWGGTGNWAFNTAFVGSFDGLRAYVTRFSSLSEVEDWVSAGIPVVLSAPWHMLRPDRPKIGSGHLVVCVGFTADGNPIMNDPAGDLIDRTVRQTFRRADVAHAWATSHNTVYLIYPMSAPIPPNRLGQWETESW